MIRVVYSDRAKAGLREILLYIGELDPNAALRLLDDLERRLDEVLTRFPEAGPRTAGGERVLTIRRYPFVYRHDAAKGEVVVLDVFGPGMDWR